MPKYILIIEDDEALLETMKRRLERAGYEIAAACDGQTGLDLLQKQLPDLVITDLIMPEMEGIELIRAIRADYPELSILAVSGGGRMEPKGYLKVAKNMGAHEVLEKPFTNDELLAAVEKTLG